MAQAILNRSDNGQVMAAFLKACKQKGRRKISLVTLSLTEDG